jgi:hypothetical protein
LRGAAQFCAGNAPERTAAFFGPVALARFPPCALSLVPDGQPNHFTPKLANDRRTLYRQSSAQRRRAGGMEPTAWQMPGNGGYGEAVSE